MVERGEIWWANLPASIRSEPGYPHPIVVVQSDDFNQTDINTIIGVVITSNIRLAEMPGNVLVRSNKSGLPTDSVANVTQIVTVDQRDLTDFVSLLDERLMSEIDDGMRLVLAL